MTFNLWTMIVAIVALCYISEMYKARLKANRPNAKDSDQISELVRSVDRLEERMANVETIILDQEKRNVLFAEEK